MSILAASLLLPLLSQGPAVGERFPVHPFPPVAGAERAFGSLAFTGKPALLHVFASW
ncbi:MAG: hypothetical protein O3A20_03580 [Planctomycetota bacterium]|nr:hypothetical protein [Planctomycetota bacterium]